MTTIFMTDWAMYEYQSIRVYWTKWLKMDGLKSVFPLRQSDEECGEKGTWMPQQQLSSRELVVVLASSKIAHVQGNP